MKFLFDTVNILVAELYRFFLIGKYHKYICISCVMFLSPGIFFTAELGCILKLVPQALMALTVLIISRLSADAA